MYKKLVEVLLRVLSVVLGAALAWVIVMFALLTILVVSYAVGLGVGYLLAEAIFQLVPEQAVDNLVKLLAREPLLRPLATSEFVAGLTKLVLALFFAELLMWHPLRRFIAVTAIALKPEEIGTRKTLADSQPPKTR